MSEFLDKMMHAVRLNEVPPAIRKIIVGVIGGTVFIIGICLIVLPGPAFIVIPAGLAILATEFVWARRWLKKIRNAAVNARNSLKGAPQREASPSASPNTK